MQDVSERWVELTGELLANKRRANICREEVPLLILLTKFRQESYIFPE